MTSKKASFLVETFSQGEQHRESETRPPESIQGLLERHQTDSPWLLHGEHATGGSFTLSDWFRDLFRIDSI